jgi:molecular chaperone DnaJ
MGKKYYEVLGLPQNAPLPEIAKQFRVLALTYHPSRQQADQVASANFKLAQACEAYEVLSNGNILFPYGYDNR